MNDGCSRDVKVETSKLVGTRKSHANPDVGLMESTDATRIFRKARRTVNLASPPHLSPLFTAPSPTTHDNGRPPERILYQPIRQPARWRAPRWQLALAHPEGPRRLCNGLPPRQCFHIQVRCTKSCDGACTDIYTETRSARTCWSSSTTATSIWPI